MRRPVWRPGAWWDTVGGRYAVSLPGWLLTLVVGINGALVTAQGASPIDLLAWAGIAFVAHLGVGVIFLIAWFTYLRPSGRRPRPVAAIATYVVVAVVRALIMGIGGVEAGLMPAAELEWRLIAGTVTMVLACSVAAVTVTYARDYSRTMAELRQEQRRQEVMHEEAQFLLDSYREDLLHTVEEQVSRELARLSASGGNGPGQPQRTSPQLSNELRRIVDEVVRPLSHEFARRRVDEDVLFERVRAVPLDVRMSPLAITTASFTTSPFTPGLTTAALAAMLSTGLLRVTDQGTALLVTVISLSVVFIGLCLAKRFVAPRLPLMALPWCVATVVVVWEVVALAQWAAHQSVPMIGGLVGNLVGGPSGLSMVGIDMLVMLVIAVATGLGVVLQQVATARAEAVEATTHAAARLRQVAWAEQRELGRLIHSDVQARIISTAIRISIDEQADVPLLLRDLEDDLRAFFDNPAASEWRKALSSMTTVWRLSTDFEIVIPDDVVVALDADWAAAAAVVELVSEATTNTIRHGGATTIRASIALDDDTLVATVDSDGTIATAISSGEGQAGLGTRTFDRMTLEWRCEPGGRGTLTTAVIPLGQHTPVPA